MNNMIINWRFGCYHFQVWKWDFGVFKNTYWVENKPEKWFEAY